MQERKAYIHCTRVLPAEVGELLIVGTLTEYCFLLDDMSSASTPQHVWTARQLLLQLTTSFCWQVHVMIKVTQQSTCV